MSEQELGKDALGYRAKIGILVPASNTIVEPEMAALQPPGVSNHVSRMSRVKRPAHDLELYRKFLGKSVDMDGAIDAVNPGNSAEPLVGAACSSVDCSSMALWSWVTGTMVAATLWETGQPNNGFTQKIAAARQVSSTWTLNNVDAATATRPYICECDP